MASKAAIATAINAKVGAFFSMYRIGLTHDVLERRRYWGETQGENIKHWVNWPADSLSDAQAIESHFINQGMKGGVGGNLTPGKTTFVYVF
jgi:hypothetical protein